MSKNQSRGNANNHANQLNPNNDAYWSSRGAPAPASGDVVPTAAPAPAPAPTSPAPAKR
jgi:hypothetical protein